MELVARMGHRCLYLIILGSAHADKFERRDLQGGQPVTRPRNFVMQSCPFGQGWVTEAVLGW